MDRAPVGGGVAGGASGAVGAAMDVLAHVARNAVHRGAAPLLVYVASGARRGAVGAGERVAGVVVIERGGGFPVRGYVAALAGLAQFALVNIGADVAADAGLRGFAVEFAGVA